MNEKLFKCPTIDIMEKIVSTEYIKVGKQTIVCLITLKNGYEIVGSACSIDLENFNEDRLRSLAYANTLDKMAEYEDMIVQKLLMLRDECEKEPIFENNKLIGFKRGVPFGKF